MSSNVLRKNVTYGQTFHRARGRHLHVTEYRSTEQHYRDESTQTVSFTLSVVTPHTGPSATPKSKPEFATGSKLSKPKTDPELVTFEFIRISEDDYGYDYGTFMIDDQTIFGSHDGYQHAAARAKAATHDFRPDVLNAVMAEISERCSLSRLMSSRTWLQELIAAELDYSEWPNDCIVSYSIK